MKDFWYNAAVVLLGTVTGAALVLLVAGLVERWLHRRATRAASSRAADETAIRLRDPQTALAFWLAHMPDDVELIRLLKRRATRRLSPTTPPSLAVLVDGRHTVILEPAYWHGTRIDRICQHEKGLIFKAIRGATVDSSATAVPPALQAGWRTVGLVVVHPAATAIFDGAISNHVEGP